MNERLLALAISAAALALPASAQAAPKLLLDATTELDAPLTANAGRDAGTCHRAYRPDAAGVAARDVTLSGPGSLEVRLDGRQGDWDVAVFDAAGKVLAADASPDAQEVASGFALKGGVVHVQACRRSGGAVSVPATLEHSAIAPGAMRSFAAAPAVGEQPPARQNRTTPSPPPRRPGSSTTATVPTPASSSPT